MNQVLLLLLLLGLSLVCTKDDGFDYPADEGGSVPAEWSAGGTTGRDALPGGPRGMEQPITVKMINQREEAVYLFRVPVVSEGEDGTGQVAGGRWAPE